MADYIKIPEEDIKARAKGLQKLVNQLGLEESLLVIAETLETNDVRVRWLYSLLHPKDVE